MASCSSKIHFCSLSLANLVLCCILIIRVEYQVRSVAEVNQHKSQNDHLQGMGLVRRDRRSVLPVQNNQTDMMTRLIEMEKLMKRLLKSHITVQKLLPGTPQFILQGPPGMPGTPGTPGLQGKPGTPGLQGKPGTPGLQGKPGTPGTNGRRGRRGRQGKKGPPGVQGPQGVMGPPGVAGPPGPKGPLGPPGTSGAPGARGTPGESISSPRVIISPQSLTVDEHQTVRLYCSASGNPKPQISWAKEENSKNIQLNITTAEMIIKNITFDDRGRYICTATSMMGTSQDSADILVRAPPRFRSISSSTTIGYIGLKTKLACDIVGYPQPRVTWRRSQFNQLSISGPRFTVRRNSLIIQNTQKVDAGSYMCRGSNGLGTILDLRTLKVQDVVPARMVGKPPPLILVKSLQDTVRLTCTAAGSPTPIMHWEKNGINIPHSEVKVKGINSVKSEVVLKHFAPSQSNIYTCVANNTLSVKVKTKTRVEMRSCSDPGIPTNGHRLGTRFWAGETVTYVCNVGYTLVGPDTIMCQPDGLWTQNRPSCRRKCGDPGTIDHGDRTGDHLWQGESLTFLCNDGAKLRGNKTLTCLSNGTWSSELPSCVYPKDCKALRSSGILNSGVYTIEPDGGGQFNVFCDMDTDGGGWTVIQRRRDGSVDFYWGWTQYKNGFGSLTDEFWLGNDNIHRLTASRNTMLRVDVEDWSGNRAYAKYGSFRVDDENNKYRLTVGSYSGTAGDSLASHNGMFFTTKDRDNDKWPGNCAQTFTGAWWYNGCHHSNLNGRYIGNKVDDKGINWQHWKSNTLSMKRSTMMIRS